MPLSHLTTRTPFTTFLTYAQFPSSQLYRLLTYMPEYSLKFSPSVVADTDTFKLLELPSDVSKLIEDDPENLGRQAHCRILNHSTLAYPTLE